MSLFVHAKGIKTVHAEGNQIYSVTLRPTQLRQASFLQKKSNVAKWFFDICNAEIAQCRQKICVIFIIKWFKN